MWQAVLFDLDDTLVDHAGAARGAVVAWARERGVTGSPDEVAARWAALTRLHYDRYQQRELTYLEQRRARVRDFLTHEALVDDADVDVAFGGYRSRYEAAWTAFPDAAPALRRARESGAVVAVLTNGEHDQQAAKLTRSGLAPYVDHLVASSTLSAAKPHVAAFDEACARVRVAPDAALMVGDSLHHDVHGARAAGLDAVWVDRTATGDAGPDVRRVSGLDELFRD